MKLGAAAPQPVLAQWQIDADIMGLSVDERELHRILCNVHAFTCGQYETLREVGYGTLPDLVNWSYKDISTLLSGLSNRPENRGGMRYGDRRIRQVQAVTWFVNDLHSIGVDIGMDQFEVDPDTYMQYAALAANHDSRESNTAEESEKFKYSNWIAWEESVDTYLASIKSASDAPLSYVVRKDLSPNTV